MSRFTLEPFETALRASVRAALPAAGGEPLGIFLTSGPASGLALAMARAETSAPLHTYLLRFDESTPSSDFAYAARLARRFGATHQEIMAPAAAVAMALPYIIASTSTGLCDSRTVAAALLGLYAARDGGSWMCGAGAVPPAMRALAEPASEVGEILGDDLTIPGARLQRRAQPQSAHDARERDARLRAWRAVASAHGARLAMPFSDDAVIAAWPADRARTMRELAALWLPGEVVRRVPEPVDVPLRAWLCAAMARPEWQVWTEAFCKTGSQAYAAVRDPEHAPAESVVVAWHLLCLVLRNRFAEMRDDAWRTPPALPIARSIVPAPSAAPSRAAQADTPTRVRGRRKPLVLIVGPLPPPLGGVQIANELLLLSSLADDVDFHVVDTSKKRLRWAVEAASWRTPVDLARHAALLARDLVRLRPDAVYVHAAAGYSLARDFVMMGLARATGAPVVCHYHGTVHTHFPSPRTPSGRAIGRFMMSPASRVICLGPSYASEFSAAWGRTDLTVVPNLAEVPTYAGLTGDSRATWLAPGEKGLLFVGRLSAPKGIWEVLAAAPAILAAEPRTRLLLMGLAETAEKEGPLRDYVRDHGLRDHVTFLGSMQGTTKALAYATAHALILPSWTEAFPLVIPEAMAAGLPMVVTDVGCIPDYVKDGADGFLIPPKDAEALAARVIALLADEPERQGIAAHVKARGVSEFDVEAGAAIVRAVLAEVIPHLRGVAPA